MKRFVNVFSLIGLLLVFCVIAFMVTYWRFTNPDMTETRLFLTYWKEFLSLSFVFIVFAIGYSSTKK